MNKEKTFRGEFLKGFAEDIPGRKSGIDVLSGLFSAVWKQWFAFKNDQKKPFMGQFYKWPYAEVTHF